MILEFDRSAAPCRGAAARLRGGSAGAISAAVSVAAHGWTTGGKLPDTTALSLLATASIVTGVIVAGRGAERRSSGGLIAVLLAGQLLGHLAMGFSSGHLHHGDLQLSPTMLIAHLFATIVAAIAIRGAENAYRIGTAVLARVLPARHTPPVAAHHVPLRTTYRDRAILRVLATESLRTRAPPVPVAC
ncbi:hypothetical protein ACL02S_09735 [Nocardia sp. 004]|uniref:hypothetical protein n=1 Tax=Nocardia sp. 004 TaxID=3385978 RepID=UPI0039A2728F